MTPSVPWLVEGVVGVAVGFLTLFFSVVGRMLYRKLKKADETGDAINKEPILLTGYGLLGILFVVCILCGWSPLILLVPGVLLPGVPKWLDDRKANKIRNAIEEQLPVAVRVIASATRAGLTLVQAIARAAQETPEPIAGELRSIYNRWQMCGSLDAALEETRTRLGAPGFNLFASALLVNRIQGGDIWTILFDLASALDLEAQCRRQIKSSTSEGQGTMTVLMFAPFGLLALMLAIDTESTLQVLTDWRGQCILVGSAIPTAAGLYIAKKILDVKV